MRAGENKRQGSDDDMASSDQVYGGRVAQSSGGGQYGSGRADYGSSQSQSHGSSGGYGSSQSQTYGGDSYGSSEPSYGGEHFDWTRTTTELMLSHAEGYGGSRRDEYGESEEPRRGHRQDYESSSYGSRRQEDPSYGGESGYVRSLRNLGTVVRSLRMAAVKSPAMVAVRSSRTVDPTPTGADTAVVVGRSRLTNPVHHTGKMNLLVAIMHREDMEMSLVKNMGEDEADMVETSTRLLVVMTSMAGAVAMRASVVATVTAVRRGPSTVVQRGAMEEVTHRRTTAVVASMREEVGMVVAGKKHCVFASIKQVRIGRDTRHRIRRTRGSAK